MANTSEWEWRIIDRKEEALMTNPFYIYRIGWVLVRTRVTDAAYSSELGDSASSLTAYNAGVTETVSAPTVRVITSPSGNSDSQIVYPTGTLQGGYPLYESDIYSKNCTAAGGNVAHKVSLYYDTAANRTGGMVSLAGDGPPYNSGTSCQILLAQGAIDSFELPSGFVASNPTLDFQCVSDSQVYDNRAVDWYTQQQTWIARSRNTCLEL